MFYFRINIEYLQKDTYPNNLSINIDTLRQPYFIDADVGRPQSLDIYRKNFIYLNQTLTNLERPFSASLYVIAIFLDD